MLALFFGSLFEMISLAEDRTRSWKWPLEKADWVDWNWSKISWNFRQEDQLLAEDILVQKYGRRDSLTKSCFSWRITWQKRLSIEFAKKSESQASWNPHVYTQTRMLPCEEATTIVRIFTFEAKWFTPHPINLSEFGKFKLSLLS